MINTEIRERLFSMADEKYKAFQSALMPTVDKSKVIGVRTPQLRLFAKELYRAGDYDTFLSDLPHKYYEEDNLHALLIDKIKDFDECVTEIEKLLPFIDNWVQHKAVKDLHLLNQTGVSTQKLCLHYLQDHIAEATSSNSKINSIFHTLNRRDQYVESYM